MVLAAGADSGDLLAAVPEVCAPTRPVKGQTLRLDAPAWFTLEHVVRGVVQGRPVYVVPRAPGPDGHREVVVGATSEEHPTTVARPRAVSSPCCATHAPCCRARRARARGGHATRASRHPDNLPLLGATTVPGLVLATGHYRNGVLLAPVTGPRSTRS
ncbi:FAD-dependent oxidoreductase [Oerskovia sp. M15]